MHKITKRIVAWSVKPEDKAEGQTSSASFSVEPTASKKLQRPKALSGVTFKIKNALQASHGIYMTVNHVEENGKLLPFEIFLNTKSSELQAMMQVLSLTLTTMFRTRTDITHLLQEFKTIQSDKGGYWSGAFTEKPKYYTHLVGEIAEVLEIHLEKLKEEEINNEVLLEEREAVSAEEAEEKAASVSSVGTCPDCKSDNTGMVDGCFTCRDCGHSKCG